MATDRVPAALPKFGDHVFITLRDPIVVLFEGKPSRVIAIEGELGNGSEAFAIISAYRLLRLVAPVPVYAGQRTRGAPAPDPAHERPAFSTMRAVVTIATANIAGMVPVAKAQ